MEQARRVLRARARYSDRAPTWRLNIYLSVAGDPIVVRELSKNDLARIVKTLQDDDVVGFVAAMTERLGVRYICRLRRC